MSVRRIVAVVLFAAFVVLLHNVALPAATKPIATLTYNLSYDLAHPSLIHISIKLPAPADGPLTLIMPRSVPGAYAQRPYDPFVSNVKAFTATNTALDVRYQELGPRWQIGKSDEQIDHIEYEVDVARMEQEVFSAADSSRVRDGYGGFLGYSIFAFLEGHEDEPLRLNVSGPTGWPVFSTLNPQSPPAANELAAYAENYYALADSQIAVGPKLQVRRIDGATSTAPLFLAVYAESDEDIAQEGALAREALDKVTAYFGQAPFANYTVMLELLQPISPRHEYDFSMEHLNSGTFYLSTARALTPSSSERDRESHRFNYAHHIAHSWIPKRAYGVGYLPFNWEMTPIIDTIWFNEGFARYASIEALAEPLPQPEATRYRAQRLDALRAILDAAPPFIRHMSLTDLSREGSFLYSADFRTGQNLFARGALMAAEMDDRIRAQSQNKKSLRDALRHLMEWSALAHRAFRTEELPAIFREATGVDTADILDRWMRPPVR
jgi:predicted metalloprotease with PDZ domain